MKVSDAIMYAAGRKGVSRRKEYNKNGRYKDRQTVRFLPGD